MTFHYGIPKFWADGSKYLALMQNLKHYRLTIAYLNFKKVVVAHYAYLKDYPADLVKWVIL